MEDMEPIESNSDYQEINGETPSPKSLKLFNILSDKNNIFLITLEPEIDLLNITACDNKLIKNYYKEKFSLQYLRKYFGHDPDIEKCSSEIIKIATQKKGIIRELKSVIELKFPLNTKDHLEISFLLKKIEKSNSEKFEQLYGLINNLYEEKEKQKKEIDQLKKELKEYTHQEIHIIGLDGKEYGSSIEINFFGENKFKEYMNFDIKEHDFYAKALFKYDKSKKDAIQKIIEEENGENEEYNISIENDCFCLNIDSPKEEKKSKEENDYIYLEMVQNFLNIKDLLNVNINFMTELLIKDILEKKSKEEIIGKFFQMKLIIKGISINLKFLMQSLLSRLENINKIKFTEDSFLSKQFHFFKIALNNKVTYMQINKHHVDDITKLNETENIIKIGQLKLKTSKIVDKELLNYLDFEDFIIFWVFPKIKIGLKIRVMLNTFNEVVNQIFEDVEECKKNANDGFKAKKKEKNENKENVPIKKKKGGKIDDNEMKILKKFREEFNLDEKEFTNEHLIEVLRKNQYDIQRSFSYLFE